MGYTFKVADRDEEFEQIHRLNYRTFVEEIPQHPPNPERRLVDRFHEQNTYLIALDGDRLAGMVAMRAARPFSLDAKIPDLDRYLPPHQIPCEVRLLAIDPDYRSGAIAWHLLTMLVEQAQTHGYDLGVMSATSRQLKLYRHLGFIPFGPEVGPPEARFQPMLVSLDRLIDHLNPLPGFNRLPHAGESFLPGPVALRPEVRSAFPTPPHSHRAPDFMAGFRRIQSRLTRLTRTARVEILLGSGTLANDAVAGQLTLTGHRGLILSNGEFGERLVDHGTRMDLSFDVLRRPWGEPFDERTLDGMLHGRLDIGWVWAVHCETSTGQLNDLQMLKRVCARHRMALCLDCISSLGMVPLDLRGVWLASGVSGKGLGALPGLALVFYHHEITPAPTLLPRYLDLGYYAAKQGVPFTHSSNLLSTLKAALDHFDRPHIYQNVEQLAQWLRGRLRGLGFDLVVPESQASPSIVTVALSEPHNTLAVGEALEREGLLLSFRSEYLLARNWLQISLMGERTQERLEHLLQRLAKVAMGAGEPGLALKTAGIDTVRAES
ncbi:MAG: hypothetical protein AUJ55_07475 [Proteobacteria bacterium CG1_02_64_396]|nr:MAG: hypothetical protein AUJ55_07475 [Proteobacteria bacterium CG1_02_64_396]